MFGQTIAILNTFFRWNNLIYLMLKKTTMKKSINIFLSFLIALNIGAQNIPHANFTAPWGVEVNTYNGNLLLQRSDLVIPNEDLELDFSFTYNSFRDTINIGYGMGWTSNYSLHYETIGIDSMVVERASGRRDLFINNGTEYSAAAGIFDRWEAYDSGKFRLTTKQGMRYFFDDPVHQKLTKIETANGNAVQLIYTGTDLTSVIDQSGRSVSLMWNDGQLMSIVDPNFSTTRTIDYSYDGNRLSQVSDPMGGSWNYGYDNMGQLDELLDQRGNEMRIGYNEEGKTSVLVTCITQLTFAYNPDQQNTYVTEKHPEGDRVVTYNYDEAGKLIQRVGSCCGFNTRYQYDEDNNINMLTDANGNQLTASHDANGNTLLSTDAEGSSQSFTFQNTNNRLTGLTDKKGNSTSFQYDSNGNLTSINEPQGVTREFTFDGTGNIASLKDANNQTTSLSYNANNDVTLIQYPIGTESYQFDAVGNMTTSSDGNNNGVTYTYDVLDRLKSIADDLGNEVEYDYDAASNLTQEKDANNNERNFTYDAHHRLESVNTAAGTTQYTYDASDNLTSITDANQHATTFSFDQRNLLVAERDPLNNSTTYVYDGLGNILTKTDANGNQTNYSYDNLNRVTSKSYDGNTDNYSYDANSNLIQTSNNHISISYTYDELNRMIAKSVDNWNESISYEYDGVGNRTKMTDPSGVTTYEYDANNRLTKITNPSNETTVFTYDLGGRMTKQDYANGTYATYEYDVANRLTKLIHYTASNSILNSYEYTYDGNGNRTSMTTTEGTAIYTYDGNNRVKTVDYTGIVAPDENYEYDGAGNRINWNGTTYTYDAADRLQSAGTTIYTYDANGNLIEKSENGQKTRYHYDGENRLVWAEMPDGTVVEYQYDPFGNRISQSGPNGTTRYLLDGENVLMELDATGNTLARYTAALSLDSWISMERDGQSYFYHKDGLGSVTALTNNAQNVESAYQYDAYGNILSETNGVANPYTFTGRSFDNSTGLYYYRTRYYDAAVGRFITKDEFPGFLRRPLSFNKYTYAEGNPINYLDQDGQFLPLLVGIGVKLIGGIAARTVIKGALFGAGGKLAGQLWNNGFDFACLDYADIGIGAAFGAAGITLFKGLGEVYKGLWSRFMISRIPVNNPLIKKSIIFGSNTNIGAGIVRLSGALGVVKYLSGKLNYTPTCDDNEESDGSEGEGNGGDDGNGEGNDDDCDICIPIVRAIDPNEIIAPDGCGIENWVAQKATLPYTVLYENDPDFATAPAQTVVIQHTFDADLNPFSFRLGDFGFGNYYFEVPDDVSYYNTQIDLSDSLGVILAVTAGVDIDDGRAFWVFESRDPATGFSSTLPADVGYLPVNDSISHAGEGFVNFTVEAKPSSETGDTIHAQALIFFDDNLPIETNLAFNLIDADGPVSQISNIDTLPNDQFLLTWIGSDEGSGLTNYLLYVSTNDGPFLPIADELTGNEYLFSGQVGESYQFFTISIDCAGNIEPLKTDGEEGCALLAEPTLVLPTGMNNDGSISIGVVGAAGDLTYEWSPNVSTDSMATNLSTGTYFVTISDALGCATDLEIVLDSTIVALEPIPTNDGLFIHRMYPVPAHSVVNVAFTSQSNMVWLEVFAANGQKVLSRTVKAQTNELNLETLEVSDWAAGSYLVRMQTRNGSVSAVFVKQ